MIVMTTSEEEMITILNMDRGGVKGIIPGVFLESQLQVSRQRSDLILSMIVCIGFSINF